MSKAGTPPKVDGISQMTGAQHTPFLQQVESVITDAGGTLIESDSLQFRQALNSYASIANFYIDTGTATEYVLNPQGAFKAPIDASTTWNGMLIRFRPTNNNTGVATLRLAGLNGGLPFNILREDGATIQAGDFSTTGDSILRYDSTASAFLLLKVPNASQTVAGILKTSTTALVNAGNNDLTAITPLQLKTKMEAVRKNIVWHNTRDFTETEYDYAGNVILVRKSMAAIRIIGTNGSIVFNTAFPTACYNVQISLEYGASTGSQLYWNSPSTTGFNFGWSEFNTVGKGNSCMINIIATGK